MMDEVAQLRNSVAAARGALVRFAAWRGIGVVLGVASAVFLFGAVASRLAPVRGVGVAGAVAATLVAGIGLLLVLRKKVTHRDAALFLDRVLSGEEHFIAALELGRDEPDHPATRLTSRRALSILEGCGGVPRMRLRVEWFAPALLLVVAAGAVFLLPRASWAVSSRPTVADRSSSDGAPPSDAPGGPGATSAGDGRGTTQGGASPGGDGRAAHEDRSPEAAVDDAAMSSDSGEAGDETSGEGATSGSPGSGSPGSDSPDSASPQGVRDLLRKALGGGMSQRDREGVLRTLEIPESSGAGSAASAGPDGPSAGRYPRRYREVVSRYFDPSR